MAFEAGFELQPDHQCAYNLAVCAHASGDPGAMREAFWRLVQVPNLGKLMACADVRICAKAAAGQAGVQCGCRCRRRTSCWGMTAGSRHRPRCPRLKGVHLHSQGNCCTLTKFSCVHPLAKPA